MAEIAATRSLNAQLFFVMQHTKRSIKKDPTAPIEITTAPFTRPNIFGTARMKKVRVPKK